MRSIVLFLLIAANGVAAQECEKVVALSKVVSTSVSDKANVDQRAADFCSQYASSHQSGGSTNIGASYKFFAASFGNSNMSADEVASKVCSSSNSNQASSDAYKNYVETISPNAYAAYQQCLNLAQSDLKFDVDLASVLPAQFSIAVSYRASGQGDQRADMTYSASDGISCAWSNGKTTVPNMTLPDKSQALFTCSRTNQGHPGYVKVARTNGSQGTLTIPWPAYNSEGVPVNTLTKMQSSLSALVASVNSLQIRTGSNERTLTSITGARTINIYQCPSGNSPNFHPGGPWGSYGCQGQISSSKTCQNIEYPNSENRTCDPIGVLRLF